MNQSIADRLASVLGLSPAELLDPQLAAVAHDGGEVRSR